MQSDVHFLSRRLKAFQYVINVFANGKVLCWNFPKCVVRISSIFRKSHSSKIFCGIYPEQDLQAQTQPSHLLNRLGPWLGDGHLSSLRPLEFASAELMWILLPSAIYFAILNPASHLLVNLTEILLPNTSARLKQLSAHQDLPGLPFPLQLANFLSLTLGFHQRLRMDLSCRARPGEQESCNVFTSPTETFLWRGSFIKAPQTLSW